MVVEMWSWFGENHGAVSAIASCLTLVVWVLYFQLLYLGFRQTQRANIQISVAGGPVIDAECILANMSRQPIYVEAVAIAVTRNDGTVVQSLSDLQMDTTSDDLRSRAMQGPLASGEMIALGPFRKLLARAGCTEDDREISFSLTAIALYAGEDRLVAAQRDFLLRDNRLLSKSASARQLRSWRDRLLLDRLLQGSAVIDRGASPIGKAR
jgi:hypothetical protein